MVVYVDQELLPSFSHLLDKQYDLKKYFIFGIIGLTEEGNPTGTGVVVAEAMEDVLNIEWIYVDEKYRKQGIGQQLLHEFIERVRKLNTINEITAVFSENAIVKKMFDNENFVSESDVYAQYRNCAGELTRFDDNMKNIPGYKIAAVTDVNNRQICGFSNFIFDNNIDGGLDLPIDVSHYTGPSAFVLDEDLNICGAFLSELVENEIYISWIYCNPKHPKAFYMLLANITDKIISNYPKDTNITFTVLNEQAMNLSKYFFKNSEPSKVEVLKLSLV